MTANLYRITNPKNIQNEIRGSLAHFYLKHSVQPRRVKISSVHGPIIDWHFDGVRVEYDPTVGELEYEIEGEE